jgi:hypothetical protein
VAREGAEVASGGGGGGRGRRSAAKAVSDRRRRRAKVASGDRGSVRRQGRRLIAKEASGGGVGCRRGEVADGCGGDDAAATAGWRSGGG